MLFMPETVAPFEGLVILTWGRIGQLAVEADVGTWLEWLFAASYAPTEILYDVPHASPLIT